MSFGIDRRVFLPPKPLKQGKLVEKTCEFVIVGLYRAHVKLQNNCLNMIYYIIQYKKKASKNEISGKLLEFKEIGDN